MVYPSSPTYGRFWKVAERPQCDIDSCLPDVEGNEEADMPF